jgi:hypothetical protein
VFLNLEMPGPLSIGKRDVRFDLPRFPFRSVRHIAAVVTAQARTEILSAATIDRLRPASARLRRGSLRVT